MVDGWVKGVGTLATIARKYPQTACVGFTQSLQAEWQYLSRIVPDVGTHMGPVEETIRKEFIPALLDLPPAEVTDSMRALLSHGVK